MEEQAIGTNRLLTFSMDTQNYCISLEGIQEVISFPDFTPIPNSPQHFLGVMDLRGTVIPIIDLRLKLGITPSLTHETAIIIYRTERGSFGIVVDAVDKVIAVDEGALLAIDQFGGEYDSKYIPRVIENNNVLTLMLDIHAILSEKDRVFLQSAAAYLVFCN